MKAYSDGLRDRVVAAMAGGMSCRAAGERFGVAPSIAGNWYRRYLATESYSALPMGGDRRSKLLDQAGWICEYLAETPDLRLIDVERALAGRGVETS